MIARHPAPPAAVCRHASPADQLFHKLRSRHILQRPALLFYRFAGLFVVGHVVHLLLLVHPRVCGEHSLIVRSLGSTTGSPPRVCGEHLRLVWVCAKRLGSSPRVRGECSVVLTTQ
nr:MAG TPA: hypothetical protein [Caudoviricetes sp.]